MMKGKRKFYIGGVVICIAIAYLIYNGLAGGVTYYYTVSELTKQMNDSVTGENYRVSGTILPESVQEEVTPLTLTFTITDGEEYLPVTYHGAKPDTFRSDGEVVVEGYLDSIGVFQASTILTKCPSKYEPVD